MKFRKTITDEFEFIRPSKFKSIFGFTFREWKSSLDENDERKRLQFCEAYCCIDPYNEDLYGDTCPLIRGSEEELDTDYKNSCDAI